MLDSLIGYVGRTRVDCRKMAISDESSVGDKGHIAGAPTTGTGQGREQSPSKKSNQSFRKPHSGRERDMMEFSPKGDVTGVHYEDEKGLGGCRIQ